MMQFRSLMLLFLAALLLSITPACMAQEKEGAKDIVDTAVAAGKFKTLAAALKAADLIEPLKGEGPFTVFAPTDDAFAKLPEGTVKELLKPENKEKLAAILTYHVVPKLVMAEDVVKLKKAKTLLGAEASIAVKQGKVLIDNAVVTVTDIECKNGVIHVIDAVILPKDVVDTAVAAGSFKTLAAALGAADLVDALKGKGPFTVLAPTDEAFAKLPDGTVEELLKPKNKDKLVAILTYHVIAGRFLAEDVVKLDSAKTLQGEQVAIKVDDHGVRVNSARVIATDIVTSNGVIHVIDQVLLPPEKLTRKQACQALITRAIELGVPMYNAGDHAACAAVYEVTTISLIALADDEMPKDVRQRLRKAMEEAKKTHDPDKRAWALRNGLDAVRTAMSMEE